MYWPLGAPQVYIVNKSLKKHNQSPEEEKSQQETAFENTIILGLHLSRAGHLFGTITHSTLTIWQTSPVVALASVVRSPSSLQTYGANVNVLLRPDSSIAVVQTSLGFLVTYHLSTDANARVYQQIQQDAPPRRRSLAAGIPTEERIGQREVNIRFRMIIKIDAGIDKVLALEDELVVATKRPAAVQCIRWTPDNNGTQTTTELLNRMPWMNKKSNILDMIYDRAMSLYIFITSDGRAYAVQKASGTRQEPDNLKKLFRGYGFHAPSQEDTSATKGAINARFSLLAIGCTNGTVCVYTARDYVGNIPLSHTLAPPASLSTSGPITSITYSPDGYCLFVCYEKGWVMWSVYGKQGASSFGSDLAISQDNDDCWLTGIQSAHWISGGSEIMFTIPNESRIWVMELAKSAVTGCFNAANLSRMLLHTASSLMLYRGHDLPNLVPISADPSLWHQVQIPAIYLARQKPIRCATVSPDGRYIAVAGRRGLAHYSVNSGRWKTFDDTDAEDAFMVRGGMCWHEHILIAAVEVGESHELHLYSRELGLNQSSLVFAEQFPAPIVVTSRIGEDSVLVYTQENILYHYVITASNTAVQLVQMGQIGLHGIVRAPARVRAVTWFVPDYQLFDGDPSQDVVHASVLFLVDAKLVLLQPSKDDDGALKYDMRIVAYNVEHFVFTRDQYIPPSTIENSIIEESNNNNDDDSVHTETGLRDSLWYFDGQQTHCWTDIQDLLKTPSSEGGKDVQLPISISTDFYPASIALQKGVIIGIEPDLVQRRDVYFAFFRFTIRTQLFLPPILHHYISTNDSTAALNLSYHYRQLPYFSHAHEVLLHTVLDAEVESPPLKDDALLPSVLSFLSTFPDYLDILVQCTRKTEVRSWRTLFAYLPPPQELFEESLQKGLLKTAGGYLLVLHTFEELESSSEQCIRLFQKAKATGDWDLCKELARFLMALDESGLRLREAMERINLRVSPTNSFNDQFHAQAVNLNTPRPKGHDTGYSPNAVKNGISNETGADSEGVRSTGVSPRDGQDPEDYFSSRSD